jgi:hypothetical protein
MGYEITLICDSCGKNLDALVKVKGAEGLEFNVKPHTCKIGDKEKHTKEMLEDRHVGFLSGPIH